MKTALEKKIYSASPVGSRVEVLEVMLSQLKHSIIESSGEDENQVVGGIIFQFVTQNYSKSKIFCESLFRDLLKYSNIRGKVDQAVQTSKPLSLDDDVEFITHRYQRRAIGPAALQVLTNVLSELNKLKDTVKMIPGSVRDFKILGKGPDKVKLGWKPPEHNPEAVEKYIVLMQVGDDGEWEEAKRTKKTEVLITRLRRTWNKFHYFKVVATNSMMTSIVSFMQWYSTPPPVAATAIIGTLGASIVPGMVLANRIQNDRSTVWTNAETVGFVAATVPLTLLLAPISVPITVGFAAKTYYEGDLTPVSDDEDELCQNN